MDTPNKEGQKLPMLTPKNPDGSQRVIKQIMVIDPNKLRVAGLDLKMAEALKKCKGRAPSSPSESRSKEDKLALAKSKLNKKLKQVQLSKQVAKNNTAAQLSSAKPVEDPLRKLSFSNQMRTYAGKPQIKVTDLKSLMPPPTSPLASPGTKPQTIVINFLKPDEKAAAIDVNFLNLKSEPQVKVEADAIPKASIKRITGERNEKPVPKTIESKVISPGVKFEMKRRPEVVTLLQKILPKAVERKLLPPSDNAVIKYKTTPVKKNLPKVIESKILSADEKIDISTLRVNSPTKVIASGTPMATAKQSCDDQNNSSIPPQVEPRIMKKEQDNVNTTCNVPSKPVVEESAVDFIKFMFETRSTTKPETKLETEQSAVTRAIEEDATSFLMSLFGQQEAKSSSKTTVSPDQSKVQSNKISEDTKCVCVRTQVSKLVQAHEAKRNDVSKTLENKEDMPTSRLPKESAEDKVDIKQEKPSLGSKEIPKTDVEAGLLHHENLPQNEIVTRPPKTAMSASPESIPVVNASVEGQPSENVENPSSTTVGKSTEATTETSISPTVSSSPLKVNDDRATKTTSMEQNKKEDDKPSSEDNLKGNETTTGQKDISKTIQKDPEDKVSTPPNETNTPQKDEAKAEEASKTTTTTRRKGKKSVPVLIAKLNRSRKSVVPQEKPVEKVEKNATGSSEIPEPSPIEPQSIESPIQTSEPPPSDETIEMPTVVNPSGKSPRKRKDTLTDKKQVDSSISEDSKAKLTEGTRTRRSTSKKNSESQDVLHETSVKATLKPQSKESDEAVASIQHAKIETLPKSTNEEDKNINERESEAQNQEKQPETLTDSKKVETVVSPSAEGNKSEIVEAEMTNTPIEKSKVVDTPTTSKRMSLRSTMPKTILKKECLSKSGTSSSIAEERNKNVSKSVLPKDIAGESESIPKTSETATDEKKEVPVLSPGGESSPQENTISKDDQSESQIHEDHQELKNAHKPVATTVAEPINDQISQTIHHEQENSAISKSDPAESSIEVITPKVDLKVNSLEVDTTVKQRGRRSKDSKTTSTELDSSVIADESISTKTSSLDKHSSPLRSSVESSDKNPPAGTKTSKESTDDDSLKSKTGRSTKKKKESEAIPTEVTPSTSKTRRSTKKNKSDEAVHTEFIRADTTDCIDVGSPSSNIVLSDEKFNLEPEVSKEKCDHGSSTEAVASEVITTEELSSAQKNPKTGHEIDEPDSKESRQVLPETEASDSQSEATISESRTPRSRKKTAKFEEYSRASVRAKSTAKDPQTSTPTIPSVGTSLQSPQHESLTGKHSKKTPKSAKGKSKIDSKKQDDSEDGSLKMNTSLVESSKLPENKNLNKGEEVPPPNSDDCRMSDDSNGFEESAPISSLMEIVSTKEKPIKQGKAKNPFKKRKPAENEEGKNDPQSRSNPLEETGFLGFNEKEIEEGQQSTSLRLSQSEDVIPLQIQSPPESSSKKKASPRVKKTPLSGGKKQKAEQKNWTKSAAESMRCWLKAPDNSTEAGHGPEETPDTNKMNSSIPPKKRRDRDQSSGKSTKPNEGEKQSEDDASSTSKALEKNSKKPKIEESPPKIDKIIEDSAGPEKVKPKKESGRKRTETKKNKGKLPKSKDELIILNPTEEGQPSMDVSSAQIAESSETNKHEEISAKNVGSETMTDLPETSKSLTSSDDILITSKKSKSKKRKTSLVENDPSKVTNPLDDSKMGPQTSDLNVSKTKKKTPSKPEKKKPKTSRDDNSALVKADKVNALQDSTSQLEITAQSLENLNLPNKSEEDKSKESSKDLSEVQENANPLQPKDDFITPTKSQSRKRKRPVIEESTPEMEKPPPKIPREHDNMEVFLTPPTPKRRGRPPKNEPRQKPTTPYRPKPVSTPPVPVSPLEKKYKNDTEFNPRLLLIRRKEELKTDEPINDPDTQTVPKSKDDIQCALCMGYCAKTKWLQHISGHYGIGWAVGTPPPLNIKSRGSVLNYMVDFFKLSKVKGLNCRLCQGQRRSALGLLSHLEQCCLTEDEIKESRIVCEHCNNNYSKASISIHLRTCHALLKKSRIEAKEDEQATEGVTEEEVLSNTGRLKRKSVIKAENKFKNLDDIEFLPDEFIKHIPQQLTENHPSIWLQEIQSFGKAFCVERKCPFTATTVEELQQHCQVNICSFMLKPGYLCRKCKFHGDTIETVRSHVVDKHKPRHVKEFEDSGDDAAVGSESSSETGSSGCDEEDENEENNEGGGEEGKPKKKKKSKGKRIRNPQKNVSTKDFKKLLPDRQAQIGLHVAKWHENFIETNYSKDPLFPDASPCAIQTDDDSYDSYFPKSPMSMKFLLNGFNGFVKEFGKTNVQPDEWQSLERLQGTGLQNEHTSYLGGPVKSIAWAPLDPHPPSMTQYLATATKKGIDKFTRFVQPKRSRSLVYIQKYDISNPAEICGEVHYAFPIDTGPVHCIQFLPSGGYAPEINRLGLLAVATVESEIKIYSLPLEVEKKNCDNFPIIRLEPSYELCLELEDHSNEFSEEYQSQCMDLVWSHTTGHNYIIGGYLNGYVAIWDISDDEDNLNRFLVDDIWKFVPVSYFWTIDNRIKQIAAHYDTDGLRWLAVSNSTRKLLIYDLREITNPVLFYVDTTKNVCNSIDWPIVWENISYGLGEAMPSHGCCINTVSPMSLVFINRRFDKFCCGVNNISFNPWKNIYAAGAENGDIHVTTLREAILDVGLRMKNDEKAISTIDIVPLDGDANIEETSQKGSDSWRLFEAEYKEKYGLVFSSVQRILASRKPEFYSKKRIPPLNISRLLRVNRVLFNPNQNANTLLAVGYDNGFLRVLRNEWQKPLKE